MRLDVGDKAGKADTGGEKNNAELAKVPTKKRSLGVSID